MEELIYEKPRLGYFMPLVWDEPTVLREEWKAPFDAPCCVIDANNRIWNFTEGFQRSSGEFIPRVSWQACLSFEHPIVFAPNLKYANKIVHNRNPKNKS